MGRLRVLVVISGVFALSMVSAAHAQETPLAPASASWTANDVLYWGTPLAAAILALIIGIPWHAGKVKRQLEEWPSPTRSSGGFASLCGGPVILTVILFLAVGGFFAYIALRSPETRDEWITHERLALWSLGISAVGAFLPWFSVTSSWRRPQ
jgi:hypothetical protein